METFWSDLATKYPKAVIEWLEFITGEKIVTIITKVSERGFERFVLRNPKGKAVNSIFPMAFSVTEYFDGLGIVIEPEYSANDGFFACKVIDTTARKRSYLEEYPDRIEPTKAGIQKAFEIREAQLNQASNENPTHAN